MSKRVPPRLDCSTLRNDKGSEAVDTWPGVAAIHGRIIIIAILLTSGLFYTDFVYQLNLWKRACCCSLGTCGWPGLKIKFAYFDQNACEWLFLNWLCFKAKYDAYICLEFLICVVCRYTYQNVAVSSMFDLVNESSFVQVTRLTILSTYTALSVCAVGNPADPSCSPWLQGQFGPN